MGLLDVIFGSRPFPAGMASEVNTLVDELVTIGIKEDYLSEIPGMGYNAQCRHVRTRAIGKRLDEIGGNELMLWAFEKVKKKAGKVPASHLEFAWHEVGRWEL